MSETINSTTNFILDADAELCHQKHSLPLIRKCVTFPREDFIFTINF
jgi:hypothetical protein